MKQFNDAPRSKFPQHKNDEMLNKLLESLKKTCEAMIDTIEAYQQVTTKKDGR